MGNILSERNPPITLSACRRGSGTRGCPLAGIMGSGGGEGASPSDSSMPVNVIILFEIKIFGAGHLSPEMPPKAPKQFRFSDSIFFVCTAMRNAPTSASSFRMRRACPNSPIAAPRRHAELGFGWEGVDNFTWIGVVMWRK